MYLPVIIFVLFLFVLIIVVANRYDRHKTAWEQHGKAPDFFLEENLRTYNAVFEKDGIVQKATIDAKDYMDAKYRVAVLFDVAPTSILSVV